MFDAFVSWIEDVVTGVIEMLVTMMIKALQVNIDEFISYFPVASVLYTILQSVALAMVIAIAGWALIKFFGLSNTAQEHPLHVLVYAVIAGAMIFFGNTLLVSVVNLTSYPYGDILEVSGSSVRIFSFRTGIDGLLATFVYRSAAMSIVRIILFIALYVQLLRLLLEIVERWLMLGVIVYTSPLIWPTLVSGTTRQIFTKWLNMFFSQCLMMIINAWSIRMAFSVISSINDSNNNPLIGMVFALSFVHVARQFDSYIKQIGLNPTITGRTILDDMMQSVRTAAETARAGSRYAGGGGGAVLGSRSAYGAAGVTRTALQNRYADGGSSGFVSKRDRKAESAFMSGGNVINTAANHSVVTDKAEGERLAAHYRNTGQLPDGYQFVQDPKNINLEQTDARARDHGVGIKSEGMGRNAQQVLQGDNSNIDKMLQDKDSLDSALNTDQWGKGFVAEAKTMDAERAENFLTENGNVDANAKHGEHFANGMTENLAEQTGIISGKTLGEDAFTQIGNKATDLAKAGDVQGAKNYLNHTLGTNTDGQTNITNAAEARAHADRLTQADLNGSKSILTTNTPSQLASADSALKNAMVNQAKTRYDNIVDEKGQNAADKYAMQMFGSVDRQNFSAKYATEHGSLFAENDRTWNELNSEEKSMQLEQGQIKAAAEESLGRHNDAMATTMSYTGGLDNIQKASIAEIDDRYGNYMQDPSAYSGESASLAFGSKNNDVDWDSRGEWTNGRIEAGSASAEYTSQSFDPESGKVSAPTTSKFEFRAAGTYDNLSTDDKQGYAAISTGGTTFYAKSYDHPQIQMAPVSAPTWSNFAEHQTLTPEGEGFAELWPDPDLEDNSTE